MVVDRGFVGDDIQSPLLWGLFHKPWHKDLVFKQPGFNGKYPRFFFVTHLFLRVHKKSLNKTFGFFPFTLPETNSKLPLKIDPSTQNKRMVSLCQHFSGAYSLVSREGIFFKGFFPQGSKRSLNRTGFVLRLKLWRRSKKLWVVVSNISYFHPYLGKIPILTHIFQMGWFNHQLELFLGSVGFRLPGTSRETMNTRKKTCLVDLLLGMVKRWPSNHPESKGHELNHKAMAF